MFVEIRLYESK